MGRARLGIAVTGALIVLGGGLQACATGDSSADCSGLCGGDEAGTTDGGASDGEGGSMHDSTVGTETGSDTGVVDTGADTSSAGDASTADALADSAPTTDGPASDGGCGTVYLREPFTDNSHGWTLGNGWSITPTCASPPAPAKGNPDPTVDHTSGAAGGVAAAYACGNNPTGSSAPIAYLTSPVLDTSGASSLELGFYRWSNSDANAYMASTVDVYDGTTWVNVYTNPTGSANIVTDAAWTREEYDVTAHASTKFQVRFGYSLVSGVYKMSCWNVDDLTVSTLSCP